jgi:tyrosinase
MGALLGGASLAMVGGCTTVRSVRQDQATRPVRRSVTTLASNSAILNAYRTAIARMKALPASDRRNWTNQARIHLDYCPHGNWLFLPWHRAYLLFFERICRRLSGMADFALPYWNWSVARRIPAPFWTGQLLDPNRLATPASVADPAAVGAPVLASILAEPSFEVFGSGSIAATDNQRTLSTYGRLEGTPHNYIHGFVGGDMGTFLSPLDPIFWCHHAMVERCWINWEFDRGHANPTDPAWLGRAFTEFCDEDGNPVRVTVADTLAYPTTYYRYDDVGPQVEGGGVASGVSATSPRARTAAVKLDVLQRFTASQPVVSEIGNPATIRIPVDPGVLRSGNRALLMLEGMSMNHTEDFSVRVFLDHPYATADTSSEDPHFANAFAFFDHEATGDHHHGGNRGTFVVDLSDVLKRLDFDGDTLETLVLLVPFHGRHPRTRTLSISSAELRVVKDVAREP